MDDLFSPSTTGFLLHPGQSLPYGLISTGQEAEALDLGLASRFADGSKSRFRKA